MRFSLSSSMKSGSCSFGLTTLVMAFHASVFVGTVALQIRPYSSRCVCRFEWSSMHYRWKSFSSSNANLFEHVPCMSLPQSQGSLRHCCLRLFQEELIPVLCLDPRRPLSMPSDSAYNSFLPCGTARAIFIGKAVLVPEAGAVSSRSPHTLKNPCFFDPTPKFEWTISGAPKKI